MSDEFDDAFERPVKNASHDREADCKDVADRKAELVAEVFSHGTKQLRAGMLQCLLRPIGPLGLVAVAAGAFGGFLSRANGAAVSVSLDDATAFSKDQVFELARYADQVSPDSFAQIACLLAEHRVGVAGVSAAVALLAIQAWRQRGRSGEARALLTAPPSPRAASSSDSEHEPSCSDGSNDSREDRKGSSRRKTPPQGDGLRR